MNARATWIIYNPRFNHIQTSVLVVTYAVPVLKTLLLLTPLEFKTLVLGALEDGVVLHEQTPEDEVLDTAVGSATI